MAYRNDDEARSARKTALERELRDTTRALDELLPRPRLPILADARIATPCTARWDAMLGDDRVRHCVECKKNVYNLSSMTLAEAEGLIEAKEGRLCTRYFERTDGTILLADCEVGLASRRGRRRLAVLGVAASLAGAAAGVHGATRPLESCQLSAPATPTFDPPPPSVDLRPARLAQPPVRHAQRIQVRVGVLRAEPELRK